MSTSDNQNISSLKAGLGAQIQKLRTEIRMSQEALAIRSGLTRTTIADIERGVANPSLEGLARIAESFGLKVSDFFSTGVEHCSSYIMQPFNGNLYEPLVKQLTTVQKGELNIQVAYAKSSGVDLLTDALQTFRKAGGYIHMLVGIDQKNTTAEALYKLMLLCDELYVIHDSAFAQTYHPKIFTIQSGGRVWAAVGSNNLTRGGLCTNYESCHTQILDLNNGLDRQSHAALVASLSFFKVAHLAKLVTTIADIQELLNSNLIVTEQQSRQNITKHSSFSTHSNFGHRAVYNVPTPTKKITIPANLFSVAPTGRQHSATPRPILPQKETTTLIESEVTAESFLSLEVSSSVQETYWFEMRASTGGSRNILDLSSSAKLQGGTHPHTENGSIPGSVAFFGLDPMAREVEKDVTIVYNGIAYHPSTIKFAPNNASWRIQLKGDAETGSGSLSQFGRTEFANHILIFHKITSDHYILETMAESELDALKKNSDFWATNGINRSSKAFGKVRFGQH